MAAYQYVFVMQNLTKVFPGGKELFKGITLSFLPGAKIGVLGVNGAGKSTLLKIMAGVDKEFNGEAWAADGVKVGYLEQEPKLDPNKNVMENVMDGLGEVRDLLKEFEDVSAKFAEPMSDDEMNALIEKQAVGEHEANFTEFYKALFVFGAMIARPKSIVRIAAAE